MSGESTNISLIQVRQALLAEWDPIGIKEIPEAKNEYDGYAPEVLRLLRNHSTKQEIFNYLWSIETERMGLTGDRDATEKFAETLIRRVQS